MTIRVSFAFFAKIAGILWFFLGLGTVLAAPLYSLDPRGLSVDQRKTLQRALDRVDASLPSLLRRRLVLEVPHGIEVRVNPGLLPRSSSDTAPEFIRVELLCAREDGRLPEAKQVLSRVPYFHPRRIEISPVILNELTRGERKAVTYSCGHGNTYRKAIGVLIHETASIYDSLNFRTPQEEWERARCAPVPSPRSGIPSASTLKCREALDMNHTVSGVPYFKTLAGWAHTGFLFSSRRQGNHFFNPESDPRARVSPAEAFAVNMEFYLLDREYACHSYSMHQFFLSHYRGYHPFRGAPCTADTKVVLSKNSWKKEPDQVVELDGKRVHEIHYLHAAKGEEFSSRWGHSMYRIILCAPEREKAGPECLNDIEYHVVASYRGNVEEVTVDYLKGLTGAYPSQLFLLPFRQVVLEYTWGESRSVQSLPLRLTESQKDLFLHRVLEQYRGYTGKYYFAANNCATESLNLLKSVVSDPNLQQSWPKTPPSFLKKIVDLGLADARPLRDPRRARAEGYFYPSIVDDLNGVFSKMTAVLSRAGWESRRAGLEASGLSAALSEWLELSPADRRMVFERIEKLPGIREFDKRLPTRFYFVENQIEYRLSMELRKDRMKLFVQLGYDRQPLTPELFERFHRETREHFTAQEAVIQAVGDSKNFLRLRAREWLQGGE